MRATLAFAAMLVVALAAGGFVAVPAASQAEEPVVRDCKGPRNLGDLGRDWRRQAVVAGPLAFVRMRDGYSRRLPSASPSAALPLKVLVVVEPKAVVTVTLSARSRRFAALGYAASFRQGGRRVPLSAGSISARFEACAHANASTSRIPNAGKPWNRGTQFGGYFLVAGSRCVDVEMRPEGRTTVLRRTLRFGVTRCAVS